MPTIALHLQTPLPRSFRAAQVAGMFDLPLDELEQRFAHSLTAELPAVDGDWTIGAIVGPSGSGKTTLARAAYGDALYDPPPWPDELPLIEALDLAAAAPARSSELGARSECCQLRAPSSALRASLKHLLRVLTAVGLASPPSWLRPYRLLSTGERFRADLARAILNAELGGRSAELMTTAPRSQFRAPRSPLLVFDEFTSTLDRTTAAAASMSLAKLLHRGRSEVGGRRSEVGIRRSDRERCLTSDLRSLTSRIKFIALSCHTDVLPWLAPDWVLDLGQCGPLVPSGREAANRAASPPLSGGDRRTTFWHGSLKPPALPLAVRRIPQSLWPLFARHHYLSGGLARSASCYAAFLTQPGDGGQGTEAEGLDCPRERPLPPSPVPRPLPTDRPIAFCASLAALGWKRTKRITRLVVLPQFQGLGIGPRLAEAVANIEAAKGNRVTITASHPAIVAWCSHSPRWKYLGLKKTGSTRQTFQGRAIRCSSGRAVASFEWVEGRG